MGSAKIAADLGKHPLDPATDVLDGRHCLGRDVYESCARHRIQSTEAVSRVSCQSMISLGIWTSDTTLPTAPRAIASFGIPKTTQLSSSCARVEAPSLRISSNPLAPSSPIPVIMIPRALLPAYCAADRNRTSAEGRCRDTGGPSLIAM